MTERCYWLLWRKMQFKEFEKERKKEKMESSESVINKN